MAHVSVKTYFYLHFVNFTCNFSLMINQCRCQKGITQCSMPKHTKSLQLNSAENTCTKIRAASYKKIAYFSFLVKSLFIFLFVILNYEKLQQRRRCDLIKYPTNPEKGIILVIYT